jgi:UDP-glucose 4-epimerase
VKCLVALIDCEKAIGEVFNVGGSSEISILQLAQTVKELTGSSSEIITRSYGEVYGEDFVDMKRRMPDTTKLRETIGFTPDTPLEDILKMIISSKS